MSYSNPTTITYRLPAATLSTAATIGRFIGPSGLQGSLVDICSVVTTAVTVAANTVTVGTAGDPNAYGTLTVAISSANAVQNGATLVTTAGANLLAADTLHVINTGGECTAGAGDILVTVDWF